MQQLSHQKKGRQNMVIPKTSWGKWSVGLMLICILSLVTMFILSAAGQRGGDTFSSNLFLSIPALIAATAGTLALISGAIGLIKDHERSQLVLFAVAIGLIGTIFWLGEIIVPH
jgi:hypothetical protein